MKFVKKDLEHYGLECRKLKNYDSKISNDEYRVAMRIDINSTNKSDNTFEFHFMVQTSDGRWAECFGEGGITYLLPKGINPDQVIWSVNSMENKVYLVGEENAPIENYKSETIYFAIKGSFTEENKIEVRNIYETNYGRLYQKI